jgi:uroporphyrinogen-III synthase
MTLLVVVRPEPGGARTLADARARRLEAVSYPLFEVQPVPWEMVEPEAFDALLIGSANALRHGGAALLQYRGKPAYAVGRTSAQAAEAAGLAVVATGGGGMQPLLARLAPGHRRLLRLSGRAPVALTLPPGVEAIERMVYDSVAVPMPEDLARLLTTHALAGTVVLLHSGDAARHFAEECDRLQIRRNRLRLAALGRGSPRPRAMAG